MHIMATKGYYCLLGFKDEPISDTQKPNLNFQVNKIGGRPDWCRRDVVPNPKCPHCEQELPLVVQIYAPLDESPNHRTLYVFSCINQSCQGKSGTCVCLRDEASDTLVFQKSKTTTPAAFDMPSQWLDGADDWGEEEENTEGENGNSSNNNDDSEKEVVSIPEVESLGLEETTDDSNANSHGAVGPLATAENHASAEIETTQQEDAVISMDTPMKPTVDLRLLLCQPRTHTQDLVNSEFASFYVNVIEEYPCSDEKIDERARELWIEYQQRENCNWGSSSSEKTPSTGEEYEKSIPSHGDELVHKFINRVQLYPQQVVRYNRESKPILLKQISEPLPHCKYCGSKLIFELQLMPYLNQILSFVECPSASNPLEFGTIMIFTCSKSCWGLDSAPRQEYVVVQSEIE